MQKGAPNNWRDAAVVLQSGRHCETTKKIKESRSKADAGRWRVQDFYWRQNLNLF
jgi:hypothetical protein